MVEIDIDDSEINGAMLDISRLSKNLRSDGQKLQVDLRDDMLEEIENSIERNFDNHGTGRRPIPLRKAFKKVDNPYRSGITTAGSGADHAIPLEKGISPHKISGNPWLHFKPEDPSKYPKEWRVGDGWVVTGSVMWKPDKEETKTGYEYIFEAQLSWNKSAGQKISRSVNNAIRKSRFKDSLR